MLSKIDLFRMNLGDACNVVSFVNMLAICIVCQHIFSVIKILQGGSVVRYCKELFFVNIYLR